MSCTLPLPHRARLLPPAAVVSFPLGSRVSDDQRLHDADRAHWEVQMMAQRTELESTWGARLEETRRALEATLEEATSRAAEDREALERAAALERVALEKAVASERAALESAAAAERTGAERGMGKRLKEMEAATERLVEEARSKWAEERAAAESSWANRMADMEAKYRKKLGTLQFAEGLGGVHAALRARVIAWKSASQKRWNTRRRGIQSSSDCQPPGCVIRIGFLPNKLLPIPHAM